MPDSKFGDGLVYEDAMPLLWTPGPLVEGAALSRLNADNHQLLAAESSLEEARAHEALKDEPQALVHELQRLEYKLNILLRLTAALSVQHNALPPAQKVRLSAGGVEWIGAVGVAGGATGLLQLYVNAALPQPLRLPCRVFGERVVAGQQIAQLRFAGISEAVAEALNKLIFRHHRRLVAGARHTAS
jgi:hypothetical protein